MRKRAPPEERPQASDKRKTDNGPFMRRTDRYLLLLVLLCASSSTAMAQWTKIPYGSSQFWNEVFFVDNDHGWITGQTPLMLRTVDGGVNWIPTNLPGGNFSANRDICFLDPSFGIVSGEDGVWKTVDGGVSWTSIAPPAQLGQSLGGVWFIDRNQGVCAFGNCDNTIVTFCKTIDGGATWRVVQYNHTNVDVSVGGITFQNGTWYAAGGLGKFWTSTDNGNSWTLTNTNSFGWQEDLISRFGNLYIASANGGSCSAAFGGRVLRSVDGGVTWTSTIFSTLMWGVTMTSPMVGWTCGDNGMAYKTTDGGLTWTDSSCGMNHGDLVDDIWFSDADHGWAVGNGIYRYTPLHAVSVSSDVTICRGDSIRLTATGGAGYRWTPSRGLSCTDCPSPTAFPDTNTVYRVVIDRLGDCSVTDSIVVSVNRVGATVQPGSTLCAGDSVRLSVTGGVAVQWTPSDGLDCDTCRSPMAAPEATTTYTAVVTGANGCKERLNTIVRVVPRLRLDSRNVTLCAGDATQLSATGGGSYEWTPGTGLSCTDCPNPVARPDTTITYHVRMRTPEGCESVDSVTVLVVAGKLQLVGLDSNVIIIDTTELRSTRCRQFVVRNLSEVDKVIDRPWLVHNTEFSIPPSELPLVVPAGGEARLTICYRPTAEFTQRDTLMIPDDCPQSIPVQARGVRFEIKDGLVCDSVGVRIGEIFGGPFLRIGSGSGELVRQGTVVTTWFVGRDDHVRIELVDLRGETVRELFNGPETRGEHRLSWSSDAIPSGLYFYRITAGSVQAQSRVAVAK